MFQSSSGLLAGCNVPIVAVARARNVCESVSILIRPSGRMQPRLRRRRVLSDFQVLVSILIRPSGRMQPSIAGVSMNGCDPPHVSILIRPSGRMQPPPIGRFTREPQIHRFNPHPAFWPDATPLLSNMAPDNAAFEVSILIRPSGRMQPRLERTAITTVEQ